MATRPARQIPLADTSNGPRQPTIRCTDCRRKLSDPVSRLRRLGPECDPERRSGTTPRHQVDQDPLPGT
ncbi:DUF6011 domain-containing protein [Streptomyces sp. NPDC056437]|uniref:DUF6011 domain-containing protein n=1 Tax=Streptomyces sp. NPDC056437 TaxID=3345816 RepID=UPI0036A23AAE